MGKAVWGMVKRIILWKIKDDQNKQANLNLLREGLLALATKVGDIVSVEVGLNFSSADYDIIFIVAFADPFQLKQFQTNPEYLKIFQQAQGISTNMIFCDYMAETSEIDYPLISGVDLKKGSITVFYVEFTGDLTTYGFSFYDKNGKYYFYSISESGRNGTVGAYLNWYKKGYDASAS